jgi:hypothetical protein
MNERIRELAKQSGMRSPDLFKLTVSHMSTDTLEKFAELILQDIDKIIDDLYHSMPLEQAAVLLTLDENIKQHFYGVDGMSMEDKKTLIKELLGVKE